MIKLLFSADFQFLAELSFDQGACHQLVWTDVGTGLYSGLVETWQTSGIRTSAVVERKTEHGEERSWIYKETLLKSPAAEQAFQNWALEAGNVVINLPDRLIPFWEKLCRLDLTPEERFVSLQSMQQASHKLLQVWEKALDETVGTKK